MSDKRKRRIKKSPPTGIREVDDWYDNLPPDWQEAIDKAADSIAKDFSNFVDEEILQKILIEVGTEDNKTLNEILKFSHLSPEALQWIADHDNKTRLLSAKEVSLRFQRVSGECLCEKCGKTYFKHEFEKRVLGWEDRPFLNWLCNGVLGKL